MGIDLNARSGNDKRFHNDDWALVWRAANVHSPRLLADEVVRLGYANMDVHVDGREARIIAVRLQQAVDSATLHFPPSERMDNELFLAHIRDFIFFCETSGGFCIS